MSILITTTLLCDLSSWRLLDAAVPPPSALSTACALQDEELPIALELCQSDQVVPSIRRCGTDVSACLGLLGSRSKLRRWASLITSLYAHEI